MKDDTFDHFKLVFPFLIIMMMNSLQDSAGRGKTLARDSVE